MLLRHIQLSWHNAVYRKWATSKIALNFSFVLSSRFTERMRRRAKKHEPIVRLIMAGLASDNGTPLQLTETAQIIFQQLKSSLSTARAYIRDN